MAAPRDVQTTLNYFAALDEQPPYLYISKPPADVPETNVSDDIRTVVVHDARGKQDVVGLDVTGFAFAHHPSVEKDFVDDDKIKTAYYAEVEDILKKHTGAKRVHVFDYTIRRSNDAQKAPRNAPSRGPVQRVHVDQTYDSAPQRVELHLPDEAERLLKGRYRLINVWRPIANPVAHTPLGLADFRTVDVDEDLVAARHIYADHEGATFVVKYNPAHKWYYLSDQTPDEVTLIKCFDSDVDKARFTPHSAFADKTSPPDAPQRQSIEVRALVFDE